MSPWVEKLQKFTTCLRKAQLATPKMHKILAKENTMKLLTFIDEYPMIIKQITKKIVSRRKTNNQKGIGMLNVFVPRDVTDTERAAIVSVLENLLEHAKAGNLENMLVFTRYKHKQDVWGTLSEDAILEVAGLVDGVKTLLLQNYIDRNCPNMVKVHGEQT